MKSADEDLESAGTNHESCPATVMTSLGTTTMNWRQEADVLLLYLTGGDHLIEKMLAHGNYNFKVQYCMMYNIIQ